MKPILVVGSINMDVILEVISSPQAGESIFCKGVEEIPGGKGANQAVAVSRLGYLVTFCGRIGKDTYGDKLIRHFQNEKIDISLIERTEESTGVAYIILEENGQNRIIVNPGANNTFTLKDMEKLIAVMDQYDMILLQLEIPLECITLLILEGRKKGVKVLVDAGPIRGCKIEDLQGAWCISPNETELGSLLGREITDEQGQLVACQSLLRYNVESVILKMGDKGAMYVDKNETFIVPAYKVDVVDTTAAGDSFMAGFACSIVSGYTKQEAIKRANIAGSIAVTKKGAQTSLPYKEQLEGVYNKIKEK